MQQSQHVKLLGKYRTPRFRYGDRVLCELRGYVEIVGITDARIPWPRCKSGRARPIVLYGALVDAVRRESVQAIKFWWGVGDDTVWKWRKALGVGATNEGTSALKSRLAPESVQSEKAKASLAPALKSASRREKIAASRRGKPRPRHVIEAMRKGSTGRNPPLAEREKMRQAALARGAYPPAAGRPFTPDEDALLGTATDRVIAEQIGRDVQTVWARRKRLGIEAFRWNGKGDERRKT